MSAFSLQLFLKLPSKEKSSDSKEFPVSLAFPFKNKNTGQKSPPENEQTEYTLAQFSSATI